MTSDQAKRAVSMLYEDTALREELFDEEADVLLKWGETQVSRLAALDLTDEQFESAFAGLKRAIRDINRFIPVRGDMPPEKQKAALDAIHSAASEYSAFIPSAFSIEPEKITGFALENAPLDNIAAISALTSILAPTSDTAAPDTGAGGGAPPPAPTKSLFGNMAAALGALAADLQNQAASPADNPDDPAGGPPMRDKPEN